MNAMVRHPSWVRVLRRTLLFAPTLAFLGVAQTLSPAQAPVLVAPNSQNPFSEYGDTGPVTDNRRMEALNADRRKSMVSDAAKLVRLAQELDQEVTVNTSEGLTSKELKEVAEIEKLARNVREKMARSLDVGPVFREPPAFPRGGSNRYPSGP
jgi:hypothetical protein